MVRKFIITAEMRDLEWQVQKGEISYSRMIEILCEQADEYYQAKLKDYLLSDETIYDLKRKISKLEYLQKENNLTEFGRIKLERQKNTLHLLNNTDYPWCML